MYVVCHVVAKKMGVIIIYYSDIILVQYTRTIPGMGTYWVEPVD